jgi:hypothetical protein
MRKAVLQKVLTLKRKELMKISRILAAILLVGGVLMISSAALALITPVEIVVGDVDNYGNLPNTSDQGAASWVAPIYDGRSAAEKAATNGAQLTDCYSSIFPGYSPADLGSTGSVIIPIPAGQKLHDATFVVAMGDFQATLGGPINANFNGIPESFAFDDGYQVTKIRSFVLTPAEVVAANTAGEFICNFDHNDSLDFIAFDWFKLSANVEPVPLPPSALLLGSGLMGLLLLRRKVKA